MKFSSSSAILALGLVATVAALPQSEYYPSSQQYEVEQELAYQPAAAAQEATTFPLYQDQNGAYFEQDTDGQLYQVELDDPRLTFNFFDPDTEAAYEQAYAEAYGSAPAASEGEASYNTDAADEQAYYAASSQADQADSQAAYQAAPEQQQQEYVLPQLYVNEETNQYFNMGEDGLYYEVTGEALQTYEQAYMEQAYAAAGGDLSAQQQEEQQYAAPESEEEQTLMQQYNQEQEELKQQQFRSLEAEAEQAYLEAYQESFKKAYQDAFEQSYAQAFEQSYQEALAAQE